MHRYNLCCYMWPEHESFIADEFNNDHLHVYVPVLHAFLYICAAVNVNNRNTKDEAVEKKS